MPQIEINFIAIAIAVVLNFFIGYAWYGPLFGKAWNRALGRTESHAAQGADLAKGLVANIVGAFLLAFVLANNIGAWTPASWGVQAAGYSPVSQALQAAFFTWLGFIVPPVLNSTVWEGRRWSLFGINGGYYLVSLLVAALLITHLR
ncbi:MAG: hypothetical protein AD742_13865 [Methylibium sp. NZG]|nr:MAG: hypothetical protein AD742_13865 [Methylibium sp. NZG]